MRVTLAWLLSVAFGGAGTLFLGLRDSYRASKGISLTWDNAIHYADRLFRIGLAACAFAVFDFARRATDEAQQPRCRGGWMSWMICICVVCMVLLAVSYGMALMADSGSVAALISTEVIRGYAMVVLTAVLLPLVYALAIDLR